MSGTMYPWSWSAASRRRRQHVVGSHRGRIGLPGAVHARSGTPAHASQRTPVHRDAAGSGPHLGVVVGKIPHPRRPRCPGAVVVAVVYLAGHQHEPMADRGVEEVPCRPLPPKNAGQGIFSRRILRHDDGRHNVPGDDPRVSGGRGRFPTCRSLPAPRRPNRTRRPARRTVGTTRWPTRGRANSRCSSPSNWKNCWRPAVAALGRLGRPA